MQFLYSRDRICKIFQLQEENQGLDHIKWFKWKKVFIHPVNRIPMGKNLNCYTNMTQFNTCENLFHLLVIGTPFGNLSQKEVSF